MSSSDEEGLEEDAEDAEDVEDGEDVEVPLLLFVLLFSLLDDSDGSGD